MKYVGTDSGTEMKSLGASSRCIVERPFLALPWDTRKTYIVCVASESMFLTLGLPLKACWAAMLARSTERDAVRGCIDGKPGYC